MGKESRMIEGTHLLIGWRCVLGVKKIYKKNSTNDTVHCIIQIGFIKKKLLYL